MDKSPKWYTMFEDASGGFSNVRVINTFTNVLCLLMWAAICILTKTLVPIPNEIIMLMLGTNGIKAFQRFAENKDIETSTDSATPPVVK